MILYLIMGLMFTVGVFSDVDCREDILRNCTFFQTILIFIFFMLTFPFSIGIILSELLGDDLREQESEDE